MRSIIIKEKGKEKKLSISLNGFSKLETVEILSNSIAVLLHQYKKEKETVKPQPPTVYQAELFIQT